MRTVRALSIGLLAAGAAVTVGAAVATAAPEATASSPAGSLSQSEAAGLSFSRDEERMARDLYTYFADKYGTAPFAMIAASEQRHFDAVGVQLDRYGVDDPAAGEEVGHYADATVQKLYDRWKTQGSTSAGAAYQVGVALEKRDIADLTMRQDGTSRADLDCLYGHLEQASEHHLAAFTAASEGKTPPAGSGAEMRGRPHDGMGPGMGGGAGSGAQHRGRHAGTGSCPLS
jgi:hypothetical protein